MPSNILPYQACSKCRQVKLFEFFYKNANRKSSKNGLSTKCKSCSIESSKLWRDSNADKVRASTAEYREKNKELIKAKRIVRYAENKEFEKHRHQLWVEKNREKVRAYEKNRRTFKEIRDKKNNRRKELYSQNPQKQIEASRTWRLLNTAKSRLAASRYQKNHPETAAVIRQNRRARKLATEGRLSNGIVESLFKSQKGKCPCCKKPLGDNYHLDHIMPLALGGANTDKNVQLLRAICNNQKHAKHPIDFMQSRGFLL
jgi:HNH endonuclease